MKSVILAAVVATVLGAASAVPAQAMGPISADGLAPAAPITQTSAARERRLYMMRSLAAQPRRGYGGYGGGGYGRGYGGGGGYGRGYGYGPPAYGRRHRDHHGW